MNSKQEKNYSISTNLLFFILYLECFTNVTWTIYSQGEIIHWINLFWKQFWYELSLRFSLGAINDMKWNKPEILMIEGWDNHRLLNMCNTIFKVYWARKGTSKTEGTKERNCAVI